MENCIFCKMIRNELKVDFLAENESALAFRDINPQAPVHVLIIPKKHYSGIVDMHSANEIADLFRLANQVAEIENCENGFRLVLNNGVDGGQSVYHTHVHLLAKRKMAWPPG